MTVYHHVSTLSPIEKVEWQKQFSVINEIAMKEYNKNEELRPENAQNAFVFNVIRNMMENLVPM